MLNEDHVFEYIKAAQFFPKYTRIKKWQWKLRGIDDTGKEISFTSNEKDEIEKALKKLFKDLLPKDEL